MNIRGTVAVVTGGAHGIGRGIIERFCGEGAQVSCLDIDERSGRELAERLGPTVEFVRCDVSIESDVEAAIERTVERFGGVHTLVNNAGVNAYFDATAMTVSEWDEFFGVDLKSAWLGCKHAIPHMRAAGRGSIVNIASIHAMMTTKGMFPYAAAKSGLVGLTRNLALDVAADGIRVNAVCPGGVRTRLYEEWLSAQPDPSAAEERLLSVVPLGRIAAPAEIANLAVFLASDDSSYMTGSVITIDGGLSSRFAS